MALSNLNPYMIYIKIALVVAAVGGLIWFGAHEANIRADLKAKTAEVELSKATVQMYADAWNRDVQLKKEIADALKTIRIQSNNYIETIETSAPPAAPDGAIIQFIAPGLPTASLPGVPVFPNRSTGRTTAGAAGG